MKIVIVEGYTVNPGDLSWQSIAEFGELKVYDRTPEHLIAGRCKNADIILSNKLTFRRETILELHSTKLICVLATGYNVIDINAAKEKNITVCNVPGYGTVSVAQHTIALLLELTNRVGVHANSVAEGEWLQAPDWCYTKTPIIELADKTLGIIGFGNIGQRVARIANALGMNVIYHGPNKKKTDLAEYTDLQTLFAQSDFISLHCPLKKDNLQFVNKPLLQLMKPSAFLINTARGQLIHEQDLADALNHQRIAGAALDVLSVEPPNESNPLLSAKNCIITPHTAWISREARQRIIDTTAKNIEAFLEGKPIHVVS
ncbi:MAG TPA: D-2-hydroxyacid dehydrogenase [Chitinophagaceae bacterium]|jgi:glycerate dehydrogenase